MLRREFISANSSRQYDQGRRTLAGRMMRSFLSNGATYPSCTCIWHTYTHVFPITRITERSSAKRLFPSPYLPVKVDTTLNKEIPVVHQSLSVVLRNSPCFRKQRSIPFFSLSPHGFPHRSCSLLLLILLHAPTLPVGGNCCSY